MNAPRTALLGTAAALLLLLTACGATPDGKPPTPDTRTGQADSDDWWRVPALLHLPSAAASTAYNGRYRAEYVQVRGSDPDRDVRHVYDLTPLKDRLEIGSLGEGLHCTRQGYVVTCPSPRYGNSPPFWLRARPGAPVGEAGRIELRIQRKNGPPLVRTTQVVIGSTQFLKKPLRKSPDQRPGTVFTLNPAFAYRGELPVRGVTVQLTATTADFATRHSNCRYERHAPTRVTVAECDFGTTVTDGSAYRLPDPLGAVIDPAARGDDGLPVAEGTLTYSAWPTGAPDEHQGLNPDAEHGDGPALRLEEITPGSGGTADGSGSGGTTDPAGLTEKSRGGLAFASTLGTEVRAAEPDYEAPPLVLRGRPGEKVSVPLPPAIVHRGGYVSTRPRPLLLILPEGVTPLLEKPQDLPSDAGYCLAEGRRLKCLLDRNDAPAPLDVRIDRLVPGAKGRVVLLAEDPRSGQHRKADGNPANDTAPLTVVSR
ncbi:hypothetical protein [Streptomyces sp. NPDC051561]|uniref:hypothetical protein n=1 Tax=Streptomyces sp. NPDC051561 TaxID=3365658 RepID=UPI003796F50A